MTNKDRRSEDKRSSVRRRVDLGAALVERRKQKTDRRQADRRSARIILPEYNIPLDKNYIFKRIEIRDPYFSLEDLVLVNAHTMSAKVPVQHPLESEIEPITGAETGRHLAILGACATSMLSNPDKNYFLAVSAEMERVNVQISNPYSYLVGTARTSQVSDRKSMVEMELKTDRGELIYKMTTFYLILSENTFLRLYKKTKTDLRVVSRHSSNGNGLSEKELVKKRVNPFAQITPVVFHEYEKNNSLKASIDSVPAELCKGHFPFVPALPKAILASAIFNVAGELLKKICQSNSLRYYVKKASLRSQNLGFSGQRVLIEANYIKMREKDYYFHCKAHTNDKTLGDMWVVLSLVDND